MIKFPFPIMNVTRYLSIPQSQWKIRLECKFRVIEILVCILLYLHLFHLIHPFECLRLYSLQRCFRLFKHNFPYYILSSLLVFLPVSLKFLWLLPRSLHWWLILSPCHFLIYSPSFLNTILSNIINSLLLFFRGCYLNRYIPAVMIYIPRVCTSIHSIVFNLRRLAVVHSISYL